jgi:hypothetical protein
MEVRGKLKEQILTCIMHVDHIKALCIYGKQPLET